MSTSASRNGATILDGTAGSLTRRSLLALTAAGTLAGTNGAVAAPQGQLTYGVHVSLAPTWFDPAGPLLLAALGRVTKTARLLILGNPVANRRQPVRVAEEMAFADILSHGRVEVGFVRGVPYEI